MQLPGELKQAIDNNAFCALSTKINEKEMQNHLMWVDYKDNKILINTEPVSYTHLTLPTSDLV